MSDIDNWLVRYEEAHRDILRPAVFWAAVPLLVLGVTGVLWNLPVPRQFHEISPLLNWGSTFLMVAAIYYFIISLSLAIGLLPFLLGLASIQMWLSSSALPATAVAVTLLIAGIVGLAAGRGGSARALLQDLQLIMIGPAWLLSALYKRFGIPI